jgi:carbon monoxide dehydrogenase subunit G
MKLQGDYLFEASVAEVWKALFDPVVLAAVMPGCEKLELVDGQYVGDLNIKVGPVQGKFSGKVDLKDIVEPTSYTMIIDGRGAPGFVKATAAVTLEAEGENTRIHYDADAQVGGKIASVGQRLLEASSRAIAKQSLDGLNENIKIREAAAKQSREASAATPAPAEKAAATAGSAEEDPGGKAAASSPAEAKPEPKPPPPPVVLKRVDQKALATSIAKEVTKSLLPPPALIAIGIAIGAIGMWLIMRH